MVLDLNTLRGQKPGAIVAHFTGHEIGKIHTGRVIAVGGEGIG